MAALSYSPDIGPCAVCGNPSSRACSRCRVDYYCGKEHQVLDFARHRKGCGVLQVQRSAVLGRHVVAVRDIPAGTILMREQPLVAVTTPPDEAGHASCVGCCAVLPVRRLQGCGRCGWLVCGDACSLKEGHLQECAAFQRAKFRYSIKLNADGTKTALHWDALAALRICLVSKHEPQGSRLCQLLSEFEECPDTDVPEEYAGIISYGSFALRSRRDAAVSWLRDTVGITWIPGEDLRRALGAFLMNSLRFGAHPDDPRARKVSGLFAGFSLLEHACSSNAFFLPWRPRDLDPDDRFPHALVAARDIARGEHVTISYLDNSLAVAGTARRRSALLWWLFYCRCPMCLDATEFGLHLEAWHCGHCNSLGRRCLVRLPKKDCWRCYGCGKGGAVFVNAEDSGWAAVSRLEGQIDKLKARTTAVRPEEWESILAEALGPRGVLHPTHRLVYQVKEELVFGCVDEFCQTPVRGSKRRLSAREVKTRRAALQGALAHTRDLLRVADVVRPGVTPFRRNLVMAQLDILHALQDLPGPKDKTSVGEYIALRGEVNAFAINPYQKSTLPAYV